MRIHTIILNIVISLFIINCNGQDKKNSELLNNARDFTDNFSKIEKLYYDSENKMVFSTKLFPNFGKYTIYYIPKLSENIQYFKNFETLNNIIPIFDELNSQYYYSDSDQERINQILIKKIKSEKDFFILGSFIDKNNINIENQEEYTIQYPYIIKFYQKKENKWNYLFDKKIKSHEDEVKYNSKFIYDSIFTNNSTTSNKIDKKPINGNWKVNCKKGVGNLHIRDKDASLTVLINQIYIDLTELKRYDFENGIAYKLKEIPEDIGPLGLKLNWKEYINNEPIAYIKMIDNKRIYFYWYGFYNSKTKKREFKDINFRQETNEKDIILNKCID